MMLSSRLVAAANRHTRMTCRASSAMQRRPPARPVSVPFGGRPDTAVPAAGVPPNRLWLAHRRACCTDGPACPGTPVGADGGSVFGGEGGTLTCIEGMCEECGGASQPACEGSAPSVPLLMLARSVFTCQCHNQYAHNSSCMGYTSR